MIHLRMDHAVLHCTTSIFCIFTSAFEILASMFLKTRAIILHCIKYSDKAIIVHLISEERGRLACIVYGASNKKSGLRMAFFQPLSLIEADIEMRPDKELHRIKEVRLTDMLVQIPGNPVKNALALFLAEFLFRTVKEPQTDKHMFLFLHHSILILEHSQQGIANFHLTLLLHMTRFLGFFPNAESIGSAFYFDMMNGVFTSACPVHKHILQPQESAVLYRLMRINYENMHLFHFSRSERIKILDYILAYYRIHLTEFGEIKSLPILSELFD